jgi:hypothetical protein
MLRRLAAASACAQASPSSKAVPRSRQMDAYGPDWLHRGRKTPIMETDAVH